MKVAGAEVVVTVPLLEAVMSVPVPVREVTTAEEVADGATTAEEVADGTTTAEEVADGATAAGE